MDEFHSGDLVCVGEVIKGHFYGSPFDRVEHIREVWKRVLDASFKAVSVSVLLDLVGYIPHNGEIREE